MSIIILFPPLNGLQRLPNPTLRKIHFSPTKPTSYSPFLSPAHVSLSQHSLCSGHTARICPTLRQNSRLPLGLCMSVLAGCSHLHLPSSNSFFRFQMTCPCSPGQGGCLPHHPPGYVRNSGIGTWTIILIDLCPCVLFGSAV